jgi:membrane-bound serine protease (ClpP class)
MFLLARVLRSHRRPPLTGAEGLVGEVGEVSLALDPVGKVFVHGEYWTARARNVLPAGTRVRVIRIDGKSLEVEPAGDVTPRTGE